MHYKAPCFLRTAKALVDIDCSFTRTEYKTRTQLQKPRKYGHERIYVQQQFATYWDVANVVALKQFLLQLYLDRWQIY